ncbi:MAG TPA: class I SAM-dependent methyltransferase [Acidobacteriaceae bacterium]|nr:class I SAM-dependent methyltransferase [Acidobacteriaceae bacterium]
MPGISYQHRAGFRSLSHAYLKPKVDRFTADIARGSTVLDLGCGNGTFLSQYQDRGWKLFGLDFSTTGIEAAKQSYPDIQFVLSDAQTCVETLREMLGAADLIISTEVIEHLYDPPAFVEQVFELLKPGGRFVLSTPYHGYLKNIALAAAGKWDKHHHPQWVHGHVKFFSVSTLYKLLEDAHFENMEMTGAGRLPYLWKSMVVRCSKPTA